MKAPRWPLPPHIAALPATRPEIDGLRAIAMAGVLYVHFHNDNPVTEFARVSLFFTISGFLITHQLYGARARGGDLVPRNFYIRRALRLLPPLFLLCAVAAVFDMDGFRARAWWHLVQLSNLSFAHYQEVKPYVVGHLWSLNALEQFYLLWPLVMFLLPVADIHLLIIGLWLLVVMARVNAAAIGIPPWHAWALLCQDPILTGALAYLLCLSEGFAKAIRRRLVRVASLVALGLPFVLGPTFGASTSYRLLIEPALAVIVANAFFGYGGMAGRALGSAPAAFLSRISYGVYMYHLAVFWLFRQFVPWAGQGSGDGARYWDEAALVALTLAAATLSWHLVEAPILRLKARFPTRRAAPATDGTAPPVV